MAESTVPPLVLVTGASGFVATWLIKELLEKGEYRVRGTVRNKSKQEKVQPLLDLVPDAKYPLELVEADLVAKESWGPAVDGCTYIFHVASPFPSTSTQQSEEDLIRQAVGGTENVLTACAESGTVKRVVVTSSIAAVSSGMPGNPERPEDHVYTEEDWSDEASCAPYEKSKLKAERAAWDFVKKLEEGKKFELVVVNPGYIQGPLLSAASGGGTAELATLLLNRKMPALPNLRLGIIDVRDVVAGEIAAMFTPAAAGKRFILCGHTVDFKVFAELVKNEFQPQGYNIPTSTIPKFILWGMKFFSAEVKTAYPGVNKRHSWSGEQMKNVLGVKPRPLQQSILDTCYSCIELGLVTKAPGYLGPHDERNAPAAEGESKPTETEQTPAKEPPKQTEGSEVDPKPTEEPTPVKESETEPKLTEEPTPAEESETEPKPTEELTPVKESETEPKPTEEPTSAEGGESEPKPTEEPTPAESGETEPKPTEESTPAKGSETEPKPTEEPTSANESETEPKPTEEPTPAEGGESEPKPTEELTPAESGETEPKPTEEPTPTEDSEAEPKSSEGGDS